MWIFEDRRPRTSVEQSRSVKMKILAVFVRKRGIIERVILDVQKIVTASRCNQFCLPEVIEKLKELPSHNRLNTWRLHHDNALAH